MDKYHAYLVAIDGNREEIEVGHFQYLCRALVYARYECRERGVDKYDWVVDKYSPSGDLINRRSSIAGLEKIY